METFQGYGEDGRDGKGIGPFFQIFDRCERKNDELRFILQNR